MNQKGEGQEFLVAVPEVARVGQTKSNILITGGAGFIGSHLVRRFVLNHSSKYHIVNFDKLTYAGNLANLEDVENQENYEFFEGDIADREFVRSLFETYQFDGVLHLAAESHVDRSIADPTEFVRTNVLGTCTLLQAARDIWKGTDRAVCFYHVSTDEVYGSLGEEGYFTEQTPYSPRSPYAASKASSDHFVRAFHETYGLPVKISNCSNNYGPHQFPEKLIPLCIKNMVEQRPVPVYGDGSNVRDWLYVEDHAQAIDLVFHHGRIGETYNIGGNCEVRNLEIVKTLGRLVDTKLGRPEGTSAALLTFVPDRLGHDYRYAVDFAKLKSELGWSPAKKLKQGLAETVLWYLENPGWVAAIHDGSYQERNQQSSRKADLERAARVGAH